MRTLRSLLHSIDQQIAEIQKVKLALEASRQAKSLQDPVAWTLHHRTLKGQPFTFQDRDYMLPVYRNRHPKVIVVKARQLELTEFAVNWLLFNLMNYPYTTGLYTSRRFDQISRFSKDRLKKAVKESPTLRDSVPDTGDVKESRRVYGCHPSKGILNVGNQSKIFAC